MGSPVRLATSRAVAKRGKPLPDVNRENTSLPPTNGRLIAVAGASAVALTWALIMFKFSLSLSVSFTAKQVAKLGRAVFWLVMLLLT